MLNLEEVIESLPKELALDKDKVPKISLDIADSTKDTGIRARKRQRLSRENDSSGTSGTIPFKNANSGLCQRSRIETLAKDSSNTRANPEQTLAISVSESKPEGVTVGTHLCDSKVEPMDEDDLEIGQLAEDVSSSCGCALCGNVRYLSRENSERPYVEHLDSIPFSEYLNSYTNDKYEIENQQMSKRSSNCDLHEQTSKCLFEKFVNAVTHPEIIQKIVDKVKEEISADSADSPEGLPN